jgi:stage V sporulation protein G
MEITEVRVTLRDEDKLKAFANITLDNQIVIRGLKIIAIAGPNGFFVSMPSRKRPDGSHQDIAHPVSKDARKMLEERVLDAYEETVKGVPANAGSHD